MSMLSFEQSVIHGLYDDMLMSDIDPGQESSGFMLGAYGITAIALRDLEIGQAMIVQNGHRPSAETSSELYVVDIFRDRVSRVRSLDAGIGNLAAHWPYIKAGGGRMNFEDSFHEASRKGWQSIDSGVVAKTLAQLIIVGRSPRLF